MLNVSNYHITSLQFSVSALVLAVDKFALPVYCVLAEFMLRLKTD